MSVKGGGSNLVPDLSSRTNHPGIIEIQIAFLIAELEYAPIALYGMFVRSFVRYRDWLICTVTVTDISV